MTLISAAREYEIEFIYAISPGLDITFSNPKEISTLKRKLDQVIYLPFHFFPLNEYMKLKSILSCFYNVKRKPNSEYFVSVLLKNHFDKGLFSKVRRALLEVFPEVFVCFFCFALLGLHPGQMEVPRLGIESEQKLPAYSIAIATQDQSCIRDLHHSSWQHLTH